METKFGNYIKYIKYILSFFVFFFFWLSVQLETDGHQAMFTIKVRHGVTPKLYNTGPKGGDTLIVITRDVSI